MLSVSKISIYTSHPTGSIKSWQRQNPSQDAPAPNDIILYQIKEFDKTGSRSWHISFHSHDYLHNVSF